MGNKASNGKPKEIMLPLPVPLKESAREGLLKELLDKRGQIDVHVEERKAVNRKIRPLQTDCGLLEKKLRDGAETRDIKCEVYELPSNEVEIIRTDTREVVQRRTMTALERQGDWDWQRATQNKVDEAKAAAAAHSASADASDDAGDDDQADEDLDEPASTPAAAAPRARKSKGKPAKRAKGRSAAAHAR